MLLKFLFLFLLNNFLFCSENQVPVKALWVVRDYLTQKHFINDVLDFANKNGFNHIFAQVRGRGDAYYNSKIVPKSHLVANDFDPLDYLLKSNINTNIKIHAWINVYYLWSSTNLPTQSDHIILNKPEWLDRQKDDNYIKDELYLRNKNRFTIDGEGFYLAPTNPAVNLHLISVVDELSKEYNLDGIHYDYIRFHNLNYGYNEFGLHEFNRTYIDKVNANEEVNFSEFKRNSITNFVKRARDKIKSNSNKIIISAAVKPNIYDAKLLFFQEWDLWLSAGYLDWAVPMNYMVKNEDFIQNMYLIRDNLPSKYHDKIVVGISTYNQNPRLAGKKIQRLKKMNINNISIFSYTEFVKNPYYWKKLKKYF